MYSLSRPGSTILYSIIIIGGLTEEGYHRKMAQLDEALPSTSSSSEGVYAATEIAQGLSNPKPQLKQKINELLGSKQRYTTLPRLAKKQKNRPSKPVHRKITIVCVDN